MNTIAATRLQADAAKVHAPRVVSIDIFRGLTMAVMIFVNALPEGGGLPWWTHHAHEMEDRMTYVDMVFPFFLFIVGMSFPLSITQRLKRNSSIVSLWMHVVVRSMALVVLGLILANAEKVDPARTGMSGSVWALLGILCAGLYLNVYPKSIRFPAYATGLRGVGLVGVVIVFAIFRRTTASGQAAWIDFSYPEILGLIGISYFASAVMYIPTRRFKWAATFWFLAMLGLNILEAAKILLFPDHIALYFWPFGNGAMPCLIMAGAMTSSLFLGTEKRDHAARTMLIAIGIGAAMLVAGWLLTPLGISKIRATPTWVLWSAGAAILLFTLLYWICDIKRHTRWAFFVRPAGSNTLTTYLLPDIWYYICLLLGITFLERHLIYGWQAVLKTVVFALCILVVAGVLTKLRVRLQL